MQKFSILLLEDDVYVRHFMLNLFERYGYSVRQVVTVDEACSLAQAVTFDVVVFDLAVLHGPLEKNVGRLMASHPRAVLIALTAGHAVNHDDISPSVILVPKPFSADMIRDLVSSELKRRKQRPAES